MSPRREVFRVVQDSFPRVSGDEPFQAAIDAASPEFSPRERG